MSFSQAGRAAVNADADSRRGTLVRVTDGPRARERDVGLEHLGRLVGSWRLSGGLHGQIRFEWTQGRHFLVQHIELDGLRGIEIIGRERPIGAEPSDDIHARFFGDNGETYDHVYELEGDTLTIWSGERGEPPYFRGRFVGDDAIIGAWVYPDGAGPDVTATRLLSVVDFA